VLHIQRREDIDSRSQELFDILPALRICPARLGTFEVAQTRRPGSEKDERSNAASRSNSLKSLPPDTTSASGGRISKSARSAACFRNGRESRRRR